MTFARGRRRNDTHGREAPEASGPRSEFDPIHALVLRIEDAITKVRSGATYSGHDVIDLLLDLRASAMLESTLAELCRDPSAASAAKVLELEPSAT